MVTEERADTAPPGLDVSAAMAGTPDGQDGSGPATRPAFAHPSEEEFARILDFYRLEWQYEPRSFPLRYADDGRVVERFTPDFYLPELDLYIELTTLKQSLVTKKNRKLRRLRELYPDVKIKLLYNRDYRNLLFKYGRAAASKREAFPPEGVSGASSAVVPGVPIAPAASGGAAARTAPETAL